MTTAHRESLRVAPSVDLVVIMSDGGDVRLELVYDGPGAERQTLACVPVPAGALAQVGELLLRAAERAPT